MKAVYSSTHYKKIASALNKPVESVLEHVARFEEAAFWYLNFVANPMPGAPSALRREAQQIAKAAHKLLEHLGVEGVEQAPDGPAPRILEMLAYAENTEESSIVQAMERIGRLAEIFGSIAAVKEIGARAADASRGVQELADAIGIKGHRGNQALEIWLASMMTIYTRITGRRPKMNVGASGRSDQGKAGGKFIAFLRAAGAPLGIRLTSDAWRSRARNLLKNSPNRK